MKPNAFSRSLILAIGSPLLLAPLSHADTFVWANSNIADTPVLALDWFSGGANPQAAWIGGAPTSNNANTVEFFEGNDAASLGNTTTAVQTSTLNNGGAAFELGTLTLTGRGNLPDVLGPVTMNLNGDPLHFSGATGTINLDAVSYTGPSRIITYNIANDIRLGTAGSSSVLTLAGGSQSVSTLTLQGIISELKTGGGSLVKTGSSTVYLSGDNTYTGGTTLSGGRINVQTASGFGTGDILVTGDSIISRQGSAGALTFNNKINVEGGVNLTIAVPSANAANAMTFAGILSGSGTITSNTGTNTTYTSSNTDNTFDGNLVLAGGNSAQFNKLGDGGTVDLGGNNLIGAFKLATGGLALTFDTRQFRLAGTTGGGTIENNASNVSNPLIINTALDVIGTGNKALTLGGSNTGSNTFGGLIAAASGSVIGITKAGAGTWKLSNAANSYSGATTLSGGTLEILNLADGGSNSNIGASGNAAANLVLSGGTLRFTGAAQSTDRGFTLSGNAGIDASGSGAINLTNTATPGYGTANTVRGLTLTGTSLDDNTLAAALANNGTSLNTVTKTGVGKWVLTGTTSYGGTTTVNGGTLMINGNSSASTGAITVNSTATLGGGGSMGGAVTITASANLAPGSTAGIGGTLAIGGNLTVSALANAGAGKLKFDLATTGSSDKITVGGTLTIGTGFLDFSDFNFTALPGLQNGTYTLVTYNVLSGTLAASGLSGVIGTGGTGTLQLNTISKTLELVVSGLVTNPYAAWSGGAAFDADANGDGINNGMAFLLGATGPNVSALNKLPVVTQSGGNLTLTFSMLNAANRGSASLNLLHSSDLGITDAWTSVLVPDSTPGAPISGVTFSVTTGSPTNSVTATVSSTEAASGKLFGRLKGNP